MKTNILHINSQTGEVLGEVELGHDAADQQSGDVIDMTFTISAPYQLAEELAQPAMTLMSRPPNEVMDIVVTPRPPMQRKLGL